MVLQRTDVADQGTDQIGTLTDDVASKYLQPAQVQRDFEELPPTAVNSLRDSLLALLVKYSKCVLHTRLA